jgi:hypothetical protein
MLDWRELLMSPDEALARLDFLDVHLACATELPGVGRLNVDACRAEVNRLAQLVWTATEKYKGNYYANPGKHNNSRARFQALVLITVLQRDCGFHYNPALIDRCEFFRDSRNLFLNGVLGTKKGTCASLPTLYLAVGRRLGYPLKLVRTTQHLFLRWQDENGERFNIEPTSKGLNCFPDEHYLSWPKPSTADIAEEMGGMKSKTPREELAAFLDTRGICWFQNGQFRLAAQASLAAMELAPTCGCYAGSFHAANKRWIDELKLQPPLERPRLTVDGWTPRFQNLPNGLEKEFAWWCVIDTLLNDPDKRNVWVDDSRRPGHARPEITHIAARHEKGVIRIDFRKKIDPYATWYRREPCTTPQ